MYLVLKYRTPTQTHPPTSTNNNTQTHHRNLDRAYVYTYIKYRHSTPVIICTKWIYIKYINSRIIRHTHTSGVGLRGRTRGGWAVDMAAHHVRASVPRAPLSRILAHGDGIRGFVSLSRPLVWDIHLHIFMYICFACSSPPRRDTLSMLVASSIYWFYFPRAACICKLVNTRTTINARFIYIYIYVCPRGFARCLRARECFHGHSPPNHPFRHLCVY